MTSKTKLKDLSTQLGVSNKEMLQAARELGISAKSTETSLEEADVTRVKDHFRQGGSGKKVDRKEVQPGVIVRRRRKGGREEAPEAAAEAAPAEEASEKAPAEAAPASESAPAPKAKKVKAEPKGQAAKVVDSGARIVKPEPEEAPAARVIAPEPEPEKAAAEPETPEAPAAEKTEAVAEPVKEEAAPAEKPAAEEAPAAETSEEKPAKADAGEKAEGASETKSEGEGDDSPKKKKKRKKRKEFDSGPQVKVIALPDPEAPKPAPRPAPSGDRRPGARRDGGAPARRDGGAGRPQRRTVDFRNSSPSPSPSSAPGAQTPPPAPGDDKSGRRGAAKKGKGRPDHSRDDFGRGPRGRRGGRREQRDDQFYLNKNRKSAPTTQPLKAAKRKLRIEEAIRVTDMAHQMGIKAPEIIKILMGLGIMATINQSLDIDTATVVAAEFGYEVEKVGFSEDEYLIPQQEDAPEALKPRAPVVTIMGHVDHGKTSLLDTIRKSNVTSGEAGGITQHIGAYHVKTKRGDVCFLDTPGHEAFTAMRARGAEVTDIVILVVAADDGVMDQTREAINHSKAAGVPIVVAVNKIDKEEANPERVMRELAEFDLVSEAWGGDTIFANVSAKTGQGVDELLEMVALQAEVLELKANPDKEARGHIVEAKLDKGRGPVATVLIEEGTLSQGDAFVCGVFSGRVRAMFNDQGKKVKKAGPATPVEVQGFDGVPEAGDEFVSVEDDKVARRIAEQRQIKHREKALARESKVTLESFLAQRKTDTEVQTLNVVLKADVQGSLEAIVDALKKLATDEVKIDVIHTGAGAITETDILLASASHAIILGFNVRPTAKIKEVADQEHVEIRFYDIIYKLVGEIKDAMSGLLSPEIKEVYLGQAEVRDTFSVPKVGTIAGCAVADGKMVRNAKVRLLRDGIVTYTGTISSLKRFKDDAKEVLKGYECGIGLTNFNDIKVGDIIEAFEEVEEARTLD